MIAALVLTVGAAPLVGADRAGGRVAVTLIAAGLPVASRQAVDEDEAAVEAALRHALDAYALVVVLAGAGGAAGELVRRALARLSGTRLVLNERLLTAIEAAFRKRDRPMPRRAERQALLPQGVPAAAQMPRAMASAHWALTAPWARSRLSGTPRSACLARFEYTSTPCSK